MHTATDLQQAYDEGMAAGLAECEALRFRAERLADQAKRQREIEAAEAATKLGRLATSMAENICRLRAELAEARAALMAQAPAPAAPPAERQDAPGG